MTARIHRSLLFVPATRADRFAKAIAAGADGVVIDLEDAVPGTRKAEARQIVGQWLETAERPAASIFLRVNAPGSAWLSEDLDWLRARARAWTSAVAGIVVPKCESAGDLELVAEAAPARRVVPILETARGVLNAHLVLSADAAIPAVCFGAEDLTADLGVPRTLAGEELAAARAHVVLSAAAAGTDPIDAVWVDLNSADALRQDAERALALGFRGKMAIHPGQVPIINGVFTPTAAAVAAARRIVEASDAALARGESVLRLDDRMVDGPIVRRARRVLAIADAFDAR